jgi:hypothetical protein
LAGILKAYIDSSDTIGGKKSECNGLQEPPSEKSFRARRQQTTTGIEIAEIYDTESLDLGLARFYSLRRRLRSAFVL